MNDIIIETEEKVLLDQPITKTYYKKAGFFEKLNFSITNKNTQDNYYIKPFNDYYPRGLSIESNKVDNTKYSYFSFIFLFLFYEFSDFSNFYYLLLAVTQFYPPLEVGFKISYVLPLFAILFFRALEELFQHLRISSRDKEANNTLYPVQTEDKQIGFLMKKSQDIKVGDIIKIVDKSVPVDIIILAAK